MKGFWRTVESVFAVVLLMMFLLTIGGVTFAAEETDLSPLGYEMLRELDLEGGLREKVVSKDYEAIESEIQIPGYNRSVSICGYGGECGGEYPDSQNVMVSTYLVSGYREYQPFEVRLYIWR
jgi:hypothetical protein